NMDKPGVAGQIESLRKWFAERAEVLGEYRLADLPGAIPADIAGRAKLCVVFGGDGTLLSAGRALAEASLPLLGVNMGKLGFLAEFNVEHLQKHFDEILAGGVTPTERMMLTVRIAADEQAAATGDFTSPAVNDIAICAGPAFRMIELCVTHGENHVAQYFGDGLVVATPTGSTAYNMSAGGPILLPTLEAVILTPIASHTLSLRPMVLRPDQPIRIKAEHVNEGTSLIIDGQITRRLGKGQVVEIRRADKPMRIIPHPGRSYFEMLAAKLHWGHSPHYRRAEGEETQQ
ncbi:MAG: NAD(+)/NADH kinase, partial [Phycisphaerae bacterium]|nr:NAD(+)/NADH kinase [Phycisphaerae bacterium]